MWPRVHPRMLTAGTINTIMGQQEHFSLGRIIIFGHLVDILKSFYVDFFNCSVIEEIKDHWVVLKVGPIEIALHKIGQAYEPEKGKEFRVAGNTKLVFYTRDDLKLIRMRFIEKGLIIGDIKSFEGINSLFCDGEDPEGNVFQIEQQLD